MLKKYRYHSAVLLAALSYTSLPVFSTLLTYRQVGPFNQVLWRVVLGSIISFIIAKYLFRQRLSINRNEFWYLIVNTLIFLFAFTTFSGSIYLGTPIAKAVALNYSYPVPVIILSYLFFKELPGKRGFGAIALSLISVFVLLEIWSLESIREIHLGDFLAWINSVFFGFIIVWGTKMRRETTLNPFITLSYTLLFMLLPLFILGTVFSLSGLLLFAPCFDIPLNIDTWLILIGLSLIGTVLPLALMYIGASGLRPYITGILLLTEPVWVYWAGLLLFHQGLSLWGVLGIIGIIISVLLV